MKKLSKVDPRQDVTTQCRYHYGGFDSECRLVQLSPNPASKNAEWQEPQYVCASCREYLGRHWRYARGNYYLEVKTSVRVVERQSPTARR